MSASSPERRPGQDEGAPEHPPELWRHIVEAAPNGVLVVDQGRRIVLVNRRTEELFGYTRAELLGEQLERLIPERFHSAHAAQAAAFMADPQARPMGAGRDLHGRRKDGTEVPIEIGLNPVVTPEGSFIVASIIDITERRRRDDELRRSNAELAEFAHVASHDLQEPLRMVASFTELLAQRYKGQLDERADKYIHFAVDGARRMQRLVQDLLTLSHVGSQARPLTPVDAAAVMGHVLLGLRPAMRDAGAAVDVDPLPQVLADAGQLGQVFQNLVGNALKFRGKDPVVIGVKAVRDGELWRFSVRDNGIGLDMRHADRIFRMFQRLQERDKYDGSGIGLAVVRRIVERHGGMVWVESSPGAGATFYFTLPALPP